MVARPVAPEAREGATDRPPVGRRLDLKVGYACNNNCRFCVVAGRRGAPDRGLDELVSALRRARPQCSELVLTGGEPTLRRDLVGLVAEARRLGFGRIQLQTNGRMASYTALARELARSGLTEAVVALHGAAAATHDGLVRARGAFGQARRGIAALVAAGVPVVVKTVVVRPNLAELARIAALAADAGASGYCAAFVHAEGNAARAFDAMVPRMERAAPLMVAAARAAEGRGLDAHVEALPPCLLPGSEHLASELYLPPISVDAPEGIDPDAGATRVAEGKAKGPRCRSCRFGPVCEGVWREYPARFGWEEFVPVPGPRVLSAIEVTAGHLRCTP